MANGDAAAAAGMDVVAGTADLRLGYDEENKTRDYIAAHQSTGTHAASAINSGTLDAARIPDLDAAKITTGTFDPARVPSLKNGVNTLAWNGSDRWNSSGGFGASGVIETASTMLALGSRSFTVVTSWAAAALDGTGKLGIQPSARRFKKNIEPLPVDPDRIRAFIDLVDVEYDIKAEYGGTPDDPKQHGWIAEDLLEAGFAELVPLDTDPESDTYGQPISINYSNAVIPLHQVAKLHDEQIAALGKLVAELRDEITKLKGGK